MAKQPLIIWFESNGDMSEYGDYDINNTFGVKPEDAKDFDDCLEIVRLREFRRKNTRVILKSVVSGRLYSMFVDDFNAALTAKKVIDLRIEGTFRFVKRGTGQALKLVLENS